MHMSSLATWWVWTVGPILGALAGGGVTVLMSRFLQLHRGPEPTEESSPLREAIEPLDPVGRPHHDGRNTHGPGAERGIRIRVQQLVGHAL